MKVILIANLIPIELPISLKFINQCQLEFSQDSPKDKVDLILVDVLGNLHVPHLLDLVSNIPKWNARVENYVASIFGFANLYLTRNGCVFFFYNDDFQVLGTSSPISRTTTSNEF